MTFPLPLLTEHLPLGDLSIDEADMCLCFANLSICALNVLYGTRARRTRCRLTEAQRSVQTIQWHRNARRVQRLARSGNIPNSVSALQSFKVGNVTNPTSDFQADHFDMLERSGSVGPSAAFSRSSRNALNVEHVFPNASAQNQTAKYPGIRAAD